MTTAAFRTAALNAEKNVDWALAASYWAQAIAAYPSTAGALAQRDLTNMEQRRAGCERMGAN